MRGFRWGNIPEKQKLGVSEVFYRLKNWQKALLILCCSAAYVWCVQSTFSSAASLVG